MGVNYVALLRGINVSGHRIIKMEELRKLFESLKLKHISTYIQSGNVLFESKDHALLLEQKIEKKLLSAFGYEVKVMVRSAEQLKEIVKKNPYRKSPLEGIIRVYVSFLSSDPESGGIKGLHDFSNDLEKFRVSATEVYSVCRKDTDAKLKFSNMFIEKQLKLPATTRDMNTVMKLLELIEEKL